MSYQRAGGGSSLSNSTPRESGLIPVCDTNGKADEVDTVHEKVQEIQEQHLIPLKEDLAEWLSKHTGMDITADNFMDILDNGVVLCKMSKLINTLAHECVADGSYTEPVPNIKVKCKETAPSGSWFARDNTANFLTWCKAFGMSDDQTFETEYLVAHKEEKSIITCLLELARIGYKFGLEPPNIIKIETEMEKEEEVPPPPPPRVQKEWNIDKEEEVEEEEIDPPVEKVWNIDDEIERIAILCKCHDHVKKLGEGKYLIFGKVVQIRFLQNHHVMVRVGGGWDTLEHYLLTHSPVEVFEHRRPNTARSTKADDSDKYLCFKSKYKSPYS